MTSLKELSELSPEDGFWVWLNQPHFETLTEVLLGTLIVPAGASAHLSNEAVRVIVAKQEFIGQLNSLPKHPKDLADLFKPKQEVDTGAQDHGVGE